MQIEDKYFDKYIKYKKKYLDLKQKINHSGGFFECIGKSCFENPDESTSVRSVIKYINNEPTFIRKYIIVVPEDYDDKIFDFFSKEFKVEPPRKITKIILEDWNDEKEINPDDTFVTANIFNKETGNNYKETQTFNIYIENEEISVNITGFYLNNSINNTIKVSPYEDIFKSIINFLEHNYNNNIDLPMLRYINPIISFGGNNIKEYSKFYDYDMEDSAELFINIQYDTEYLTKYLTNKYGPLHKYSNKAAIYKRGKNIDDEKDSYKYMWYEAIGRNNVEDYKYFDVYGTDTSTIEEFAFRGIYGKYDNKLTQVTIPESVTTIGPSAFMGNQLTRVTIPNSVTTIGPSAFMNNQLTQVTIPESVTTIGDNAFAFNKLNKVTFKDKSSVKTIGKEAFYKNQLTQVTIPDSVTTIGKYAFKKNQLTEVTISLLNLKMPHVIGIFDSNVNIKFNKTPKFFLNRK